MIRYREVIPVPLEHALVANRVLAALASNDLTSRESQDAVEDGLRFLESVLEGRRLASALSVEADSYRAAVAYGEGVKAFELVAHEGGRNDDPERYLQELTRSATSLRDASVPDNKAVQELTSFFKTIRDIALASSENPIERVSW